MRRISLTVLGTIAMLVLLLRYPTSFGTSLASPPAAVNSPSAPNAGVADVAATGGTTVTGSAISTRYGIVQVQLTILGGKIAAAHAVQAPGANHRDRQISAYAVPILDRQAVAAQSAHIDGVTGATGTSGGYLDSLQSAIDQAHLS
ncbi:MAG: FMN-binding protein [Pseudonocardia sp.]|nr:FMN-binding protein [Pseudonocardia sp.]